MPAPITFSTVTNQFKLPLLFAGQAQKEFFVNQSLVQLDSLLQQSVTAVLATPPADPQEGDAYLVSDPATGDWEDNEANVAIRIAGAWQFVQPFEGMQLYDREEGNFMVYRSGWTSAEAAQNPQGGSVVDAEARAAIAELSQALLSIGVLKASD